MFYRFFLPAAIGVLALISSETFVLSMKGKEIRAVQGKLQVEKQKVQKVKTERSSLQTNLQSTKKNLQFIEQKSKKEKDQLEQNHAREVGELREQLRVNEEKLGKAKDETQRTVEKMNLVQEQLTEKDAEVKKSTEEIAVLEGEMTKKEEEAESSAKTISTLQDKVALKAAKHPENPLFSASNDPSVWDSNNHVAGNCLIQNEQGETLLFYYANSAKLNGTAVGIAKSTDDRTWYRQSPDPILTPGPEGSWDAGGVEVHPGCILKKNSGEYTMYFTGFASGSTDIYHTGKIGIATSKDLLHWEKYALNPVVTPSETGWDSIGVFEPSVVFSGNEYGAPQSFQMWYGGSDSNLRFQIGYAESIDGYTWKKYEANPVLSYSNQEHEFDRYSVEVHGVTKHNNEYMLFYEAIEEQFPVRFSIGVAFSKDGKTWRKGSNNPILEGGPVGSWDAMGAYHPSLLMRGDKALLYYVGLNAKYDHQIGIAELNPLYLYNQ